MKQYTKPELLLDAFDVEDVITASTVTPTSLPYEDGDKRMAEQPEILL